MSVMTENTLAGSGGLRRCCSSDPDKLGYEPVIRSGHYLAGQEGFKPSTIRLTAERTTAVLLTQKRKSPDVSARAFLFFMPPLKVKAAYQIRLKYDAFNPVLQDLSQNLSPFVVNVIA